MLLTTTWQEVSATSSVIQKIGAGTALFSYASTAPTTEDIYTVDHYSIFVLPVSADGNKIYGKAVTGTITISNEDI